MSNIEVLHTHLFHAHHHLYLTKMIINLKCSALRKLCVLQFQLVCNSIIKNLWNIYFVSFALKRKKEKISHKKILLCENDIANINMFSHVFFCQSCNFFLGKSRVNMSCSLRVRNRRLRTCQANTGSTSFLRTDRTGPCSSQSRIMFRAAVRLSVSGVRSLTRTQPGSRGNS